MWMKGLFATALVAGGAVAALAAAPTPSAGMQVFKARCAMCHSVDAGKTIVGPSLYRIRSRRAGAQPGYAYSPAMKGSRLVWDEATLDRYLAAPPKLVPGTNMPIALTDAQQRKAVILYLQGI